jgi:ComF family protein
MYKIRNRIHWPDPGTLKGRLSKRKSLPAIFYSLMVLTHMRQWIHDTVSFFFPVYCKVCGKPLHVPGEVICLGCELEMPRTGYSAEPDNPVAQLFWGRVWLEGATSLFRFEKGSRYQSLLHGLKYNGQKKIGIFLGKMLGAEIHDYPFGRTDLIVPVPLHWKKERKRGYNQSEIIALGVSGVTGIPVNSGVLLRNRETDTQTMKSRYERWENMEHVFSLQEEASLLSGKTVLLIDDVVTTGSTLEACAEVLLSVPGVKVFVATVACA